MKFPIRKENGIYFSINKNICEKWVVGIGFQQIFTLGTWHLTQVLDNSSTKVKFGLVLKKSWTMEETLILDTATRISSSLGALCPEYSVSISCVCS